MSQLRISVVINTYNRAASLRNTLNSFRWQNYPEFEVVVVNGPSTDNTEEILEEFADSVKVVSCPVANISVSRNIGISHASGDVIAFIDDDGIPYPNWLQALSEQYGDSGVGGVGGFVWDHTGMAYQTRYVSCDRFGEARFFDVFNPSDHFSFPNAGWYPSLMGVNSSFRNSALLEIGGFNEVYAYFLDETDVCLRIIDRGYKLVISPQAQVHHKYLASHIRDAKRRTRNFYPIIRSKTNFIMTHGAAAQGRAFAEKFIKGWISERKTEVDIGCLFGDYSKEERRQALCEIDAAYLETVGNAGFTNGSLEPVMAGVLKQFPALKPALRIVLITADFPPMANGGIGTLMKNVSMGLAELGHEIHVVSRSVAETVDFEDGTWVHRIRPRIYEPLCVIGNRVLDLPPGIKDWAGTAKGRVEFIASEFGPVDVVVSPIWDLEGCCALASSQWKSVVTLHTTYAMSVDTHPDWTEQGDYFENFIKKMIAAEKALLEFSPMLLANSSGLVDTLETVYGIDKKALKLATVPHGVRDFRLPARSIQSCEEVRGLFVGRLELRKGVDLLFEVLPQVFDLLPSFSFDLVGDDTIPIYGAGTLLDRYCDALAPYIAQGRLRVHGKVEDAALPRFYNDCDFFVAPSRFESFGLILAEALSCGKPVIACAAGGMVEVVGDAGFLAEPGDAGTLKTHLITLASNRELRQSLGLKARDRYERLFSVDRMARKISSILEGVVNGNLV